MVSDGHADHVLFPDDLIERGEEIGRSLDRAFPAAPGRLVVGPMVRVSWGGRLVTLSGAVLLELPAPVQAILLGRLLVGIPDPEVPLIRLNANVLGRVSPAVPEVEVLVSLTDSWIVGRPVSGELYLLTRGGPDPAFVLSAGGFHPRYVRPAGVPELDRLALDLGGGLGLRAEAYFAVTSNAVMFGGEIRLDATIAGCGVDGSLGLDALVVYAPAFSFSVHVHAGVAVRAFGHRLASVGLDFTLEGPAPWHAFGTGSISILFLDVSLDFDVRWGDGAAPLPPPRILDAVVEALAQHEAWTTARPASERTDVVLTRAARRALADGSVVPADVTLRVSQPVLPLDVPITRFARIPVEAQTWSIADFGTDAEGSGGEPVRARFPPGEFLALTDDEQLTRGVRGVHERRVADGGRRRAGRAVARGRHVRDGVRGGGGRPARRPDARQRGHRLRPRGVRAPGRRGRARGALAGGAGRGVGGSAGDAAVTRRWFVSHVSLGAAAVARGRDGARRTVRPSVTLRRTLADGRVEQPPRIDGPVLNLLGPGDVLGFSRALVVREEPPAGTRDAAESNLACVELADAALPWLLSPSTDPARPQPWLMLLVLRAGEGEVRAGEPTPTVTVAPSALPDPADAWAWAHVEARVDDGADGPEAAVRADVRSGSQAVVARLVCPRRLAPDAEWLAVVVPTTNAGVAAAGLPAGGDPAAPPWQAGQPGPAVLPVYHSWRFATGEGGGTFEELARRVGPVEANDLPGGFGAREISVAQPWPHEPPLGDGLTLRVQGALRLPGTFQHEEAWDAPDAQSVFVQRLTERLDAPAGRREEGMGEQPDRDERAVAPPLYGSHHTGRQRVPVEDGFWMRELNTQVRHRVAAALGARYVQVEQEFVLARAWEQAGQIRAANRLLRAAETAVEAGREAQAKHLGAMDAATVTRTAALLRDQVDVGEQGPLGSVLEASAVPDGVVSSAFARLVRPGGALTRRIARADAAAVVAAPASASDADALVTTALAGDRPLIEPSALLVADRDDPSGAAVLAGAGAQAGGRAFAGLMGVQQAVIERQAEVAAPAGAGMDAFGTLAAAAAAPGAVADVPSPRRLRALRRDLAGQDLAGVVPRFDVATAALDEVASGVLHGIEPLRRQLRRVGRVIETDGLPGLDGDDVRPLRPLLAHPRFGMPIASELIARWPEWAIPGISSFPANSTTLLEANSAFMEAVLVGLNHEFNRELLWREFPTDQRGTSFARFWPPESETPDVDEIARWADEVALGDHAQRVGGDQLVLLVRADVLRRFPGTVVLAARTGGGPLPPEGGGDWLQPAFLVRVDEETSVFGFALTHGQALEEGWMFVLREPLRGTQLGFDLSPGRPDTWANLDWDHVPVDARGFLSPRPAPDRPPDGMGGPDLGPWGADSASLARIAFQRPFQVAFSATRMLGEEIL